MDAFSRPSSGLVRTGMRAADLMMFRIRQFSLLRSNLLSDTASFAPDLHTRWIGIAKAVDPATIATSAPLGIQARLQRIRTDLDSFSNVEVQELLRHGYSATAEALGFDASTGTALAAMGVPPVERTATRARETQLLRSARRRVGLFSGRDWLTVLYVSLGTLAIILAACWHRRKCDSARKKDLGMADHADHPRSPANPVTGPSVPIVSNDQSRTRQSDFRVLDEHRVWDLRSSGFLKLAGPEPGGNLKYRDGLC